MAKVNFKDACMKLIDRTESGEFDPLVAAMCIKSLAIQVPGLDAPGLTAIVIENFILGKFDAVRDMIERVPDCTVIIDVRKKDSKPFEVEAYLLILVIMLIAFIWWFI